MADHFSTPLTLVLGLGASGLAMARWCLRQGSCVRVADTRTAPPQLAALQEAPDVEFVAGVFTAELLHGVRAVYCSPGLSPATVAEVQQAAVQRGLFFGGELDLFSQALAQLQQTQGYQPRLLAITGTNGKTTVTTLTGLLLERAGFSVAVAGNIGPCLLDTLTEALEADALPQAWVLELSSFQLAYSSQFEPTVATVLNLTQDHLDWHGSLDAYAGAKARIFGRHGLAVLNRDDALARSLLERAPAPLPTTTASGRKRKTVAAPRPQVQFGLDVPSRAGDWGLETVNGMAWLVRAAVDEAAPTRRRPRAAASTAETVASLPLQRLMPADAMRLRGRHNTSNALAALALATAAGASLAPMLHGLREYRGEPHRVQPIGTVREVEYFDDSKGTNIGATVAALNGLGASRRLVVILGGDGKGQDFAPLADAVRQHARAAVLIGRDAPVIAAVLQATGVPLCPAASMAEAVARAADLAQPGDAVLLSPACASFDMFDGYAHRAQVFTDCVRSLALDAGQELEVLP